MLVSWDWLKEYVGDTDLTAEQAAELLGMHAFELEGIEEKGDDTVIDVDILPNRSSDCLCQRGVARELASITGTALANDPLEQEIDLPETDQIAVHIEEKEACPRFTASLITGIEVKESPDWLKARLEAIGQRSINNIVDATNYVMFAIGQPIHAYDADLFPQVDGKWQFDVRYAKEGEVVSLLAEGGKDEDRDVELKGTETLIVDGSSNTPIGLAGVKGGRFAGVHEGTTKIIVEAAHFHPTITRKTARRLGIVIDASKRFENEPSRELPPFGQAETIKLITDIAGGKCEGVLDEYLEKNTNPEVEVSITRANTLLGLSLPQSEMKDILEQIGADVKETEDGFTAVGPWERTDLNIEEDFIEEIGRIHGYADVASVAPEAVALREYNKRHFYCEIIRQTLLELGFSEVITSSFRNKDKVQLKNALASDKSYLRSSLTKNISEALDRNAGFADLLGTQDTRMFEIGNVFYEGEGTVAEHVSLAIGVRLKSSGYTGKEDKIVNQVIAELSEKLGVELEAQNDKGVAEINVTELLTKLADPTEYDAVEMGEEIAYQPFSVYQHMSRDIAMWVSEGTTAEEVEAILNENAGELRVRTTLFDEFTKDGKTSFAFRLVFQSPEKTLTDEEVNTRMDTVYKAVAEKGWEVR
tara:strand:- start:1068 stop:3002 length:1935 start_codon:yes stop_codon:yes gene_type:complete